MDSQYNFTRIKIDRNGNGRLVVSWLIFGTATYAEAVKLANKIGGRRFHNKSYGGGIVFQAYSENELLKDIERVKLERVDGLARIHTCDNCERAISNYQYRKGQGLCTICIDAIN